MAFFLIGRGPDDDLRLLSTKPQESRQAAMAELSRLSAEPSFDQWDAEVSVIDLDTGVPILLVRPAAAAPSLLAPLEVETGDADAWQADLEEVELPADLIAVRVDEVVAPEPAIAESGPELAAQTPEAIPDAIEMPSWEPPTVALIEPVGDIAIAEEIVAEAIVPESEPSISEAAPLQADIAQVTQNEAAEPAADIEAAPAPAPEDNDELRAAILRTTEHMAAEGIVAPESIGLEEDTAVAEVLEAVEPTPVEVDAPPLEAVPVGAAIEQPAVAEPAAEQAAPASWPWDRTADTEAESEVAPEVAGVYDALAEPADELPEPDVEAVLGRPMTPEISEVETDSAAVADANDPMRGVPSVEGLDDIVGPTSDESDFILDLDSVEHDGPAPAPVPAEATLTETANLGGTFEPASEAPPVAAAEPAVPESEGVEPVDADPEFGDAPAVVSPLEDFTCDDCVYVETCPNRDQRLPKDCGSFQWR